MASGALRILLVEDDEDDYVLTRELLAEAQGEGFDLVWAPTYADAVREIRRGRFDVFLVDYRLGERTGLDLLRNELQEGRLAPVFILTGHGTHEVDVEAMKLGAAGYLIKGELRARELERTIRYAIERRGPADPVSHVTAKRGRVVAFFGAKGGVGTTTVAANVAAALANRGLPVTTIEMRGNYGVLSRLLNVNAISDIGRLLAARSADGIGTDTIDEHVSRHMSGLRLLAAPQTLLSYCDLRGDQAAAIVNAASLNSDLVLLDLPSETSEANREALRQADLIALVIDRSDPSSIAAAKIMIEVLKFWRVKATVGSVIVSRVQVPEAVSAADVNTHLELKKYGIVPPAPDLFYRAAVNRQPLVLARPDHAVARALDELALCMLLIR
ncbi:MAG TPA: response regulator [Candidatus Limnocylindrales bacterium]|nr:response regulator [Candidatus Limnocylindrales bacterium]